MRVGNQSQNTDILPYLCSFVPTKLSVYSRQNRRAMLPTLLSMEASGHFPKEADDDLLNDARENHQFGGALG